MSYFKNVRSIMKTRLWINNPNKDEISGALSIGAENVTTNPAYCSKLLKTEPEYVRKIIDEVITKEKNDETAADLVYQKAVSRVIDSYRAVFERTKGSDGYVTIQPDPRKDGNPDYIIECAFRHSKIAQNCMPKIPVTSAGLKAIEILLKEGIPICATEVFAISQARQVCEVYKRTCSKTSKYPLLYVTHITGIFDEYLGRYSKLNEINIEPEILQQAGSIIARKQYSFIKDSGYQVRMLGGGARGIHHFTGFIGGDMDITINWNTAEEIINRHPPIISMIESIATQEVVKELCKKLPDFRKAYYEEELVEEEFKEFGPVRLFTDSFREGYYHLLMEINKRRALLLK